MEFQHLLRHLGASLNLSSLTSWSSDECMLVIDGMRIRLQHLHEPRQVVIEADLFARGELDGDAARAMLAANFRGDHTPEAVFNIGSDGIVRMSMRRALDSLSDEAFVDVVGRFVARLEARLKPQVVQTVARADTLAWQLV